MRSELKPSRVPGARRSTIGADAGRTRSRMWSGAGPVALVLSGSLLSLYLVGIPMLAVGVALAIRQDRR